MGLHVLTHASVSSSGTSSLRMEQMERLMAEWRGGREDASETCGLPMEDSPLVLDNWLPLGATRKVLLPRSICWFGCEGRAAVC